MGGRSRPIQDWKRHVSNMVDDDGDLLGAQGWHVNTRFEKMPTGECVREIWRVFVKNVASRQGPCPPTSKFYWGLFLDFLLMGYATK